MDTPVQTPASRPGMPPITPSAEPQGIEEPSVSPAGGGEGAAFIAAMLEGASRAQTPTPTPQTPQTPQTPAPQTPTPTPQTPTPTPQTPTPQAPASVDFSNRYSQPGTDQSSELVEIPELAPETPIAEPKDMNDQQNHAWAAMRAQVGQYRKIADDTRQKFNALVDYTKKFQAEKSSFADALNKKDADIKALQDELGRLDLKRSPEFKAKYDAPLQAIRDDIARTLVDNGVSQEEANRRSEELVLAKRQDIPGMIGDLPPHAQGLVMVNAEKADSLWAERSHAIDEWRTSQEGLAVAGARESVYARAQRTAALADKAIQLVRSLTADRGMVPAFQVEDPEFANDREAKVTQFKSWIGQASDEQMMAAAFEGFMAPKTYEMLGEVMRENAQLKQALGVRLRLASPSVAPTSTKPPAPPPPPAPEVPTVAKDGFSEASDPGSAGDFAMGLLKELFPGA